MNRKALLTVLTILMLTSGCAIQYYDRKTETEHLWGFGHLKMKLSTPNEEVRAVVKGTEVLGFGAGIGEDNKHLTMGWSQNKKLEVVDENATVRLEWPTSDFFKIRVGTALPPIDD